MNLLSRRSMLAIGAVVDIALHSRTAPVAAKALAAKDKHRRAPAWRAARLSVCAQCDGVHCVRGCRVQ